MYYNVWKNCKNFPCQSTLIIVFNDPKATIELCNYFSDNFTHKMFIQFYESALKYRGAQFLNMFMNIYWCKSAINSHNSPPNEFT